MQFLNDLIESVTEQGQRLLSLGSRTAHTTVESLLALSTRLVSIRGEASGIALAQSILDSYAGLTPDDRHAFLRRFNFELGPDEARLASPRRGHRRPHRRAHHLIQTQT